MTLKKPQQPEKETHTHTGSSYAYDLEELVTRMMGPKCSTIDEASIISGDWENSSNSYSYMSKQRFILNAF